MNRAVAIVVLGVALAVAPPAAAHTRGTAKLTVPAETTARWQSHARLARQNTTVIGWANGKLLPVADVDPHNENVAFLYDVGIMVRVDLTPGRTVRIRVVNLTQRQQRVRVRWYRVR